MVNAFRHRDRENIEIYVGNFKDVEPLLPQFETVTLIGVLEYASGYLCTTEPWLHLLEAALRHLKPGGRLLLAIENKLGMKYWAGCREDHTGRLFNSIENYPESRGVQTFSKRELESLLHAAGYVNLKFYYPYPDYKLPNAIYSGAYLPRKGTLTFFKWGMQDFVDRALCSRLEIPAGLIPQLWQMERILDIYKMLRENFPQTELTLFTCRHEKIDWKYDEIESIFSQIFFSDTEDLSYQKYVEAGGKAGHMMWSASSFYRLPPI